MSTANSATDTTEDHTDTPTAPVAAMRARAESLRGQSTELLDPLAVAYRRRAAELELLAWATETRESAAPVAVAA